MSEIFFCSAGKKNPARMDPPDSGICPWAGVCFMRMLLRGYFQPFSFSFR